MKHSTLRRYQVMTVLTFSYGAFLFLGYALASFNPNSDFASWLENAAPYFWGINAAIYGYVVATVVATILDERYEDRKFAN